MDAMSTLDVAQERDRGTEAHPGSVDGGDDLLFDTEHGVDEATTRRAGRCEPVTRRPRIVLMSLAAQKPRPAPVTTTALDSSGSRAWKMSTSSACIAALTAFRRSGRST